MRFPVCWKVNFAGHQTHRKREKSAGASPSPHHTSLEERTARFIAQPFPAVVVRFLCALYVRMAQRAYSCMLKKGYARNVCALTNYDTLTCLTRVFTFPHYYWCHTSTCLCLFFSGRHARGKRGPNSESGWQRVKEKGNGGKETESSKGAFLRH